MEKMPKAIEHLSSFTASYLPLWEQRLSETALAASAEAAAANALHNSRRFVRQAKLAGDVIAENIDDCVRAAHEIMGLVTNHKELPTLDAIVAVVDKAVIELEEKARGDLIKVINRAGMSSGISYSPSAQLETRVRAHTETVRPRIEAQRQARLNTLESEADELLWLRCGTALSLRVSTVALFT